MAGNINIFKTAIENGFILSKFNLCCPDCDGPYSLTNYTDFENYIAVINSYIESEVDTGELCCLSLFLNTTDWLSFAETYSDQFTNLENINTSYGEAYTQCGATSDFMYYINQLSILLGNITPSVNFIEFYVLNYGIVEISTISGHSGLKYIYEFLSTNGLTQSENQALFFAIMGDPKNLLLNKGLVIRCVNDNILMSNTLSYAVFQENYYGSNLYLCLKTTREIDEITYTYTYANILPQSTQVNGKPFYIILYNENGVTGNYYIFWNLSNSRWEVWSGFNTATNSGTGTFHSYLANTSLDIYLSSINWFQETSITNGNVIDSSLKVECIGDCYFKTDEF
jgi:hypothetical protein